MDPYNFEGQPIEALQQALLTYSGDYQPRALVAVISALTSAMYDDDEEGAKKVAIGKACGQTIVVLMRDHNSDEALFKANLRMVCETRQ